MRIALIVLALLTGAEPVRAQHAFVLSGGAYRGNAHAGALIALEELGYDADLVVGTSMGAIIGALYAAGYEALEIREIITGENWLEHFAAQPEPLGADRAARRPLLRVGVGPLRRAEGLLTATGVNRRLVELLFDAGARAGNDFAQLPRPFRAVAADFATGEEVVLASGDLPRAVRASMAVPGVFAPVAWDDRVLIDGGVVNNLPISVARATSSLPIVAIDVVRPPPDVPERSALDVGVRGLRLLIENALPPAAPPEVLILPRIPPGLGESWFPADASALLEAGYRAAREQAPRQADSAAPAVRPAATPPLSIGSVEVSGGDASLRQLVRTVMLPAAGAYDPGLIIGRTTALYHTGLFDALWPRLEFDADAATPARLVVEIVPVTRTSVSGAARWDNDVGAGIWASLRHLFSLYAPVELRGTLHVDELGHAAAVEGGMFSTRLPGLTWIGGTHATERRVRIFAADTILASQPVRRGGGWLGAELHTRWLVSLVARADWVDDSAAEIEAWTVGPLLRFVRLPPPDAVVGLEPMLEAESRFGDVRYRRFHGTAGVRVRRHLRQAAAFVDVAEASRHTPRDVLPAATRDLAPWLEHGMHRGRARAAVGVDAAVPFVLNGYLRARLRGFAAADDLTHFDRTTAWLGGGEIGGAWPSVIGMIEAGLARGGGGDGWRLNIAAGPRF